jgi:hypothetical protein
MRSIKYSVLIVAILIFALDLSAQKVFREGYIIKNSGETLTGLVEFSDNQTIPDPCRFKRFDIARTVEYSPSAIKAYGYMNGNRFESWNIGNGPVFLEVIVTGKLTLFQRESKYYVSKEKGKPVELKKGHMSFDTPSGTKEFKDISEFLAWITEGRAGTVSDKFDIKSGIVTLITNYDRSTPEPYYIYKRSYTEKQLTQLAVKSGVNRNRFGLVAGVNMYTMNIKFNPNMYGLTSNDYVPTSQSDIAPAFGLTFERVLFRRTDRISARIDVLYNSHKFYSYSERDNITGGITRDDAWFSFTGVKIPLVAQYAITGGRIVPYVNLGAAYQMFISKSYDHTAEIENSMHEINTVRDQYMLFNSSEITGVARLGMRLRLVGKVNLHLMGMIEYGKGFFQNVNQTDLNYRKNDPYVTSSLQPSVMMGLTF